MLYDRRWDKPEVKADPFSLDSLIAWLEKQPADTKYDYCDGATCVIGQYLKSQGVEKYELLPFELEHLGWIDIAQDRDSWPGQKWTFGAALERARAVLRTPEGKET